MPQFPEKKMQKLNIILVVVFCALTLQQVKTTERRIYRPYEGTHIDPAHYLINDTTRETKYFQEVDLNNLNNYLYTLSKNDSHIFVDSTKADFHPCEMPFKKLSNAFQVTPFDKKFVLWDRRTGENSDNVTGTTLLLINPFDCNVTNIDVPADLINEDQPPFKAQVVANTDYFDIFFGGRTACMPCRFTGEGEKVTLEHQLESVTTRDASPYFIRPLVEGKPDSGYFYARSFYNGSLWTEMNVLHANFSLVKRTYVDHVIDGVTIDDAHRDIVVCYKEEDRKYVQMIKNDGRKVWKMVARTEVYCDVYDSNLEHRNHIEIPIDSNDHYVHGISLCISRKGNLYVGVSHVSYSDEKSNYSLKILQFNSLDQSDTDAHSSPFFRDFDNFDSKDGYNLKARTARRLHSFCTR